MRSNPTIRPKLPKLGAVTFCPSSLGSTKKKKKVGGRKGGGESKKRIVEPASSYDRSIYKGVFCSITT